MFWGVHNCLVRVYMFVVVTISFSSFFMITVFVWNFFSTILPKLCFNKNIELQSFRSSFNAQK